jgi:drug/metabolite transporter (DMT)-like permease
MFQKMQKQSLHFQALLFSGMLIWGLSWTNGKILGIYGNVHVIISWRFLFAALGFIPVLLFNKIIFTPPIKSMPFIILNSISIIAYNLFYFSGTKVGYASTGGILVTTLNPILTVIAARLIFKTYIKFTDLIGLVIGLMGSCILIKLWSLNLSSILETGNLYFILASISWVSVTIITTFSKKYIHFIPYTFWSFFFGFLFSLLLSIKEDLFVIFSFDSLFWINFLLISLGAMAFGQSIYFKATAILGPKKSSTYILIVPIAATIFAIIILKESLDIFVIIGGALNLTALYILNKY